jgi:chloride channel protein, CIC family
MVAGAKRFSARSLKPQVNDVIPLPSRVRLLRNRLLRGFLRLAPNERGRIFILTVLIGGVCGLAAVAFHSSIRYASRMLIERSLSASGNAWIVWTVVTPTLGAALAGVLLQ